MPGRLVQITPEKQKHQDKVDVGTSTGADQENLDVGMDGKIDTNTTHSQDQV